MEKATVDPNRLPEKENILSLANDPSQRSNCLAGKVILITGGTAGLGAESAVILARHGPARIYITGRGRRRGTQAKTAGDDVIARVEREYEEHWQRAKPSDYNENPSHREKETTPRTEIIFLPMDLSCPSSVSAAADQILSGDDPLTQEKAERPHAKPRLDILLCNAGIAAVPYSLAAPNASAKGNTPTNGEEKARTRVKQATKTIPEEEYEIQFATNFLGHALLIRKLLPLLRESEDGRIISVTSFAFRMAGIVPGFGLFELFDGFRLPVPDNSASSHISHLTNLETGDRNASSEKAQRNEMAMKAASVTKRNPWIACDMLGIGAITRWLRYAESKLAMVIYTRKLARRYPDVTSVCVTPGFVATGMVRAMRFCDRLGTRLLAWVTWASGVGGEGSKGMVDPAEGAENQVWACLVPGEQLKNGGLYDPVGVPCEDDKIGRHASDDLLGDRLWSWTENVVGQW